MFFQDLEEYNYVVYIDSNILTIRSKKIIDLLLHVRKRILEFYCDYIELFLIAIRDYCQLIFVFQANKLLIEEFRDIYYNNKATFYYL